MNRFLLAGTAALVMTAGLAAAPARADECAIAPQIRAAAAGADQQAARRALGYVATAEKLCEAGNDRAAKKKLQVAMKTLGVDQAALATTAPVAAQ
jgi:hypothetical protein